MDENLLLSLIENNAKMEVVDLAAALNETEENVDANVFSSSMVRYSRLESCCGIPFIFEDISTVKYPSTNA